MSFDKPCVKCDRLITGEGLLFAYVEDECTCIDCLVDEVVTQRHREQAHTGAMSDARNTLCEALGYPGDISLADLPPLTLLVRELCEDHAEKTKLLERVDKYLDRLEAINAERKQGLADLVSCVKDGV